MKFSVWLLVLCLWVGVVSAQQKVAATHLYHMHMPNFWPYYDVDSYEQLPIGERIAYKLDGDIVLWQDQGLKLPYVPHDNLRAYYDHDAKQQGYTHRPPNKIRENNRNWRKSGAQITFSGALMTNVQNLADRGVHFWQGWANDYRDVYHNLKTENGYRALDLVYFTYHHSMGPLIGPEYFEKELRMHEYICRSSFFMGPDFKASKGFFPTELGFSERLIPTLRKLGIEWSFVSNAHLSRTLKDYPNMDLSHTNDLISPPNPAYMVNEFPAGRWYTEPIFNQNREVVNKYPFAALPHWAKYVDPVTGKEDRLIVIPANQAASWQEGFMQVGSEMANNVVANAPFTSRQCFFTTAKDGDNSSGFGSGQDGYDNSTRIYSGGSIEPMSVQEYLHKNPVPQDDVVAVEDGSWIDTGDSPGDQNWYHWQLPPGRWQHPNKKDSEPFTVDMETGYHFQMRFYSILQAYINHAVTAEQIQIVKNGGQPLRIEQITKPVKGTANYAELAWYFLASALDSGFAYYGENVDDTMKPLNGMENSLYFAKKLIQENPKADKTGPSLWWVQRWPTNPGGLNRDKSTGWVRRQFNNEFVLFTYAYDVSGMQSVKIKVRVDKDGVNPLQDNTNEVYDPTNARLENAEGIDPSAVSDWQEYEMTYRKLPPNGMDRDKDYNAKYYEPVPASIGGDLYYRYFDQYENCLVDYYIEAVDKLGNVKRSEIQHVWIGGKDGTRPFITEQEKIKVVRSESNPPTGISGTTVVFRAEVAVEKETDGHPYNQAVKIYFDKATAPSHIAHWWFRETAGGPAIKPEAVYQHPDYQHTIGTDGKSVDTILKYDSEKGKYFFELGPFLQTQKPKFIGCMLGAPLWTEQKEIKINYSTGVPEIEAELDFSPIGGGKEKMVKISYEEDHFLFECSKKITGPAGTYAFPVSARSKDGSMETKKKYSINYTIPR